jgi:hypothetical protein
MNEHAKLFRDAFNTFALGCIGYAAFGGEALPLERAFYVWGGLYCHLVAHIAVAYGTLRSEPTGGRHG